MDWQPFVDQGCVVAQDGSVEILKSPIGPQAWCETFAQGLAAKQSVVADAIGQLPGAVCFAILARLRG